MIFRNLKRSIKRKLRHINDRRYQSLIEEHYTNSYIPKSSFKIPVEVNLTSYGNRLSQVHLTIQTIFSQSFSPNRVTLWLGSNEPEIDDGHPLHKFVNRGLEIKRVEDIGSHTKYFYALREQTNCPFVTLDDDILYPANLLQTLYEAHLKFPSCITAYRCHLITFEKNHQIRSYDDWKWCTERPTEPSKLLFPTGVGGVLYPPLTLDRRATDQELLQKLCPKADDVWLKAMSLLNNTKVYRPNVPYRPFALISGTQDGGLLHKNVGNSANDSQLKETFNHFGIDSELLLQ